MKEKKLITIIVILSLLVVGLGGYIIIDKCNNKPLPADNTKNNEEQKEADETKTKSEADLIIEEIGNNYPQGNDNDVTGDNVYQEFKDSERHSKKFTFNYNNYKIVYNYIDGGADESEITIYKNNKNVFYRKYVKSTFTYFDENEYFHSLNVLPTISNGALHLIAFNPDSCYIGLENTQRPILEYLQIDLTTNTIKVNIVKTIKYELTNVYTPEGISPECQSVNK